MVAVSQWKSQEWHWNLLQVSYLISAALQHFSMCALLPSHIEREVLSVRWLALWQEGSEHACHCSRPNKVMLMSHGKSEIQDCVQLLPQEIKPPEEIKPQQLICPMLGRGIQVPTCTTIPCSCTQLSVRNLNLPGLEISSLYKQQSCFTLSTVFQLQTCKLSDCRKSLECTRAEYQQLPNFPTLLRFSQCSKYLH